MRRYIARYLYNLFFYKKNKTSIFFTSNHFIQSVGTLHVFIINNIAGIDLISILFLVFLYFINKNVHFRVWYEYNC